MWRINFTKHLVLLLVNSREAIHAISATKSSQLLAKSGRMQSRHIEVIPILRISGMRLRQRGDFWKQCMSLTSSCSEPDLKLTAT